MLDPSIPLSVKMAEITPPDVVMARRNALALQQQNLAQGDQQLQEGKIKLDDAAKARAEQEAVNKIYVSSADASGNVDPEKFLSSLGSNNLGHLIPAYQKSFAEAKTAAATAAEKQAAAKKAAAEAALADADYYGGVGAKIAASGYDPIIAHSEIEAARSAGHDVKPFEAAVQQMGLQKAVDVLIHGSKAQRELIVTEAEKAAQTRNANASASKTEAETAGTLPETPAQKDARLNQEATRAETARHNRATEAAANPLAALTGATTTGGAPTAPGQAGAVPAAATSQEGPHGDDFLKNLPANVAGEVKAYAEGRRPFPSGMALKTPYFQSLIQMVGQYDPTFDAVNYNARSKTRSDFTSGKSAQTINALNTVIGHLDNLSTAVDNLHNTGSPLLNGPLNLISSKVLGRPNVTNFNTVKKAVADEVTRVWRQSGGTEADVKAAGANLDAANSPEQLHEAIAEYGHLLESKLSSLEDQYKQGMGTTDASALHVVTPSSRVVLDKLEQKTNGNAPPQTPEGRVRVKGPNGETGTVPKGSALPKGWTATP